LFVAVGAIPLLILELVKMVRHAPRPAALSSKEGTLWQAIRRVSGDTWSCRQEVSAN